ncbi:MAG: DMT family transporter [Betaproteobacteria bacterium]
MAYGVVVALASAVLFGLSTPLAKWLVGTISPLMLAGLLYAGSGLGLFLVMAIRQLRTPGMRGIVLPQRGEWPWLLAAIFFGGVAAPVALMAGLVTSAAATASLLLNLEGVLTALLAWFVFRENFDRRVMLGMAAIVAGGLVLAWSPGAQAASSLGLVLVVAACLCWAIDNNLTRKVAASDAMMIACLKGLAAGAVNFTLALLLGQSLPPPGITALALLVGFVGYGISLVLFVLALRHLGTARAGAYFSVAPFFGAALAVVMFGDALTLQLGIAGLLMAAGVWLHLTEHHGHQHVHDALAHAHAHSHDEHHRHAHDFEWNGIEPHVHPHVHLPMTHSHAHYPDLHHRHRHTD